MILERAEEAVETGEVSEILSRPSDEYVVYTHGLRVLYGSRPAISDITLGFRRNTITAVIGPSGCGKSTLLRCINRMNDLIPGARVEGKVFFNNEDIYSPHVDPVYVRFRIGMVFQRPNPFPMSIFDNVAFGLRVNGIKLTRDGLRRAAAETLYSQIPCSRAGSIASRRAHRIPRPYLHIQDRAAPEGDSGGLHNHNCDA